MLDKLVSSQSMKTKAKIASFFWLMLCDNQKVCEVVVVKFIKYIAQS